MGKVAVWDLARGELPGWRRRESDARRPPAYAPIDDDDGVTQATTGSTLKTAFDIYINRVNFELSKLHVTIYKLHLWTLSHDVTISTTKTIELYKNLGAQMLFFSRSPSTPT